MTKKVPVRAKEWQVNILKKMYAKEARPSASQRHNLAVETGLDEAWIRNWFIRYNKRLPLGGSAPMHRGGLLMRTIKPYLPEPDVTIHSDASRLRGPSPSHPVLSQGTSDIPPALGTLLASVNGQADKDYSRRTLAPSYALPPPVEPRSLGYIPDTTPALATRSSSSSSYSWLGECALPQNTRYSRDPLHNRYPDFSEFFLPTPCDTIHDAAEMSELPRISMSPLIHIPSSLSTVLSPDFTLSTMPLHSPIALPVSFLYPLHILQAEQAPDVTRDSSYPSH